MAPISAEGCDVARSPFLSLRPARDMLLSVFPERVASSADGYRSVDYTKLTAVLIEAVKELKIENDSLKSRLRALEVSLDSN